MAVRGAGDEQHLEDAKEGGVRDQRRGVGGGWERVGRERGKW